MNSNTKRLTEGAMMIAIIGLVLVINRQFAGILDTYLIWGIPLPIIVYTYHYDVKASLLVSFCATAVSFMLSLPTTVFYVASSCLVGVVYGYGVKSNKSNNWLLATAIFSSMIVMVITSVIFASFFGYNIVEEISYFKDLISQANIVLPATNIDLVRTVYYASIFLTGLLEGTLIHLLAYVVLKKLKISVASFTPVSKYRAPKWVGYLCIVVILASKLAPYLNLSIEIQEALFGLMTICSFVAGLFGYLLLLVISRVSQKRWILLIFIVALFVITPIAIYILVIGGLFDMVTDIRERVIRRFSGE